MTATATATTFEPEHAVGASERARPPVPLRCVLVDDNHQFLGAARGVLERQGLAVVSVASTSADALEQASALRPDITLVDIDLGEENGFELVRRLARAPGLEQLRAVLMSAHAEQDFAQLIESSPAVGFVPKSALSASAIVDVLGGTPPS